MKRMLLLAGEESGVLYARQIAAEMKNRHPEVEIRGYADYGFETSELAVIGFWAVLKRLSYFLRVKRTMERAIAEWKPEVVCTVDYPGLNLKLAAFAKARGVRAVHVVSPQVWAWRAGRIPKIEAALDKLCCFFPFEPALYRDGFAEFTGHPLADEYAHAKTERTGGGGGRRILALLPGSRMSEVEKNLSTMLKAAKAMKGVVNQVVIPAANEKIHAYILKRLPQHSFFLVHEGGARNLLAKADAAIVASGTATLEAALAGCPTVLVYRVSPLFAFIMRRLIHGIRHVGLANIVAEKAGLEPPMPELLQADFTVENILKYIHPWLTEPALAAQAKARLGETMKLLRSDGDSIARIVRFLV